MPLDACMISSLKKWLGTQHCAGQYCLHTNVHTKAEKTILKNPKETCGHFKTNTFIIAQPSGTIAYFIRRVQIHTVHMAGGGTVDSKVYSKIKIKVTGKLNAKIKLIAEYIISKCH